MIRAICVLLLCVGLSAVDVPELERMAQAVGELPVLHDGRIKPFSSVARHCLLSLSGRSRVRIEGKPALSATAWMLEGLTDRNASTLRPAIHLRNPEVAEALGLSSRKSMDYTPDEIGRGFQKHQEQLEKLFPPRDPKTLRPAESQLVELAHNLNQVFDLIAAGDLAVVPGPEASREQWAPRSRIAAPDQVQMAVITGWNNLLTAVRNGDATAVEQQVAVIQSTVSGFVDGPRLSGECAYYRFVPFTWSMACDILALLLLGAGLLGCRMWLWRLAWSALVVGTLFHLIGIGMRVWIQGRPPVATLYESIIFVGAIAAVLGIIVEWIRRRGDGAFVGATIATILHLIAIGYADDGDTMGMLVAVLNSNFWLTIHVLTITIGYGCTLVAGVVAHVALAARALHPNADAMHSSHDRALQGLSLIALLFTLFGTILGGIWADQSWGRFWGWDPKENGALLIVLWLLMMLHLRLSGLAGPRGFACGLVLCNIVVAVAWFGVNLLGIGLHSYGFASGTFLALLITTILEIVLAFGLWSAASIRQAQSAQRQNPVGQD